MNEIIEFVIKHWQLTSVFTVLVIAYVIFELKQEIGNKQVSAEQTVDLYNHQQAAIVDIRSTADFNSGHIVGAIHIERSELESKPKKLQKYAQKPVIIVCANGKSSATVAKHLHTQGFPQAVSLSGGISAWLAANLPLTTMHSKNDG